MDKIILFLFIEKDFFPKGRIYFMELVLIRKMIAMEPVSAEGVFR